MTPIEIVDQEIKLAEADKLKAEYLLEASREILSRLNQVRKRLIEEEERQKKAALQDPARKIKEGRYGNEYTGF
jgi:hypothetical protein